MYRKLYLIFRILTRPPRLPHEKGNALFLILIAVALFAALAYAVTQSGRGSGNTRNEAASLQASRLMQYAASINQAMQRIRLINGCDIDNTPGDKTGANTLYGEPIANPSPCNIFDQTSGGGLTYGIIPDGDPSIYGAYTNPPWPGKAMWILNSMEVQNIGTSVPETSLFFFNIRQDICKAINRQVGIVTSDGEPPLEDSPYEGGYYNPHPAAIPPNNDGTIGHASGADNELVGRAIGCYRASRAGTDMGYHFYYVLVEY